MQECWEDYTGFAGKIKKKGTYEYDKNTQEILIKYDNGEEEILKYEFQEDMLILTSLDGTLVFRCEKQ